MVLELNASRLGELAAYLERFEEAQPSEVLERLDVDEALHAASQRSFARRMARRDADPAERAAYVSGFVQKKAELERTKPTLASLGARRAPRADRTPRPDVTVELRASTLAAEPWPFQDDETEAVAARIAEMHRAPTASGRGGTDELATLDGEPEPPVPFVSARPDWVVVGRVRLTLLSYAELLAEVAVDPTREAAIWARYGVMNDAVRRKVEGAFRARFEVDPSERVRLGELIRNHRQRLRPGGR